MGLNRIDLKNSGLAKVVWALRQDLDVHVILGVNGSSIKDHQSPLLRLADVKHFIESHGGRSTGDSLVDAMSVTVDQFQKRYTAELKSFKTARDKVIAHSEYGALVRTLPSYDVMEKLFFFAADFYVLIASSLGGADDLRRNRPVRTSLKRLLHSIGIENVKSDLE